MIMQVQEVCPWSGRSQYPASVGPDWVMTLAMTFTKEFLR